MNEEVSSIYSLIPEKDSEDTNFSLTKNDQAEEVSNTAANSTQLSHYKLTETNSNSISSEQPENPGRRKFIKTSIGIGASMAISSLLANSSSNRETYYDESQEGLTHIDNMIMVDFAPELQNSLFRQTSFTPNVELEKKLLGDKYIRSERFLMSLGSAYVGNLFNPSATEQEILDRYPAFALLHGSLSAYRKHGEIAALAHRRVLNRFGGYTAIPNIVPIQKAMANSEIDLDYTDKLGNKGITLNIKADDLIRDLEGTTQPVVNMSFQIGKLTLINSKRSEVTKVDMDKYEDELSNGSDIWLYQFTQDGVHYTVGFDKKIYPQSNIGRVEIINNQLVKGATGEPLSGRIFTDEEFELYQDQRTAEATFKTIHTEVVEENKVRVVGAFGGENSVENARELFKLVNAFPEKLFIVAAGNYGDNLNIPRTALAAEWPENLLIVGQWNGNNDEPSGIDGPTFGADLYVDNIAWEFNWGQMFGTLSTVSVSAIANILAENNLTPQQLKTEILKLTNQIDYKIGYSPSSVPPHMSPDEIRSIIINKQTQTANVLDFEKCERYLSQQKARNKAQTT